MNPAEPNAYLTNAVMTASPPRLRLMLIDGAIRFLRETQEHWLAHRLALGESTLDRAREIVQELIASIDRDKLPEITTRLIDLYAYIYKSLIEAGLKHDRGQLDDVIRVLLIERDTWQIVCDTISTQNPPAPHIHHARSLPPLEMNTADYSGGFSMEA